MIPARRLLALLAAVWLLAPAFAPSVAAAGMEHCDHGGTPESPAPCHEMTQAACAVTSHAASDGPTGGNCAAEVTAPRPAAAPGSIAVPSVPDRRADLPLYLLFGRLRN